MGKWVHRLLVVNSEERTGLCAECGPVNLSLKDGRWKCAIARRAARGDSPSRPWTRYKGDTCERCGFIPDHPAQLDVDHIVPRSEGGSNDPSNLQTLCANCHRLKTILERTRTPEDFVVS